MWNVSTTVPATPHGPRTTPEPARAASELTWATSHGAGTTPELAGSTSELAGSTSHEWPTRSHGLIGATPEGSMETGAGVVTSTDAGTILVEPLPDIGMTRDEATTIVGMCRRKHGSHAPTSATFPEMGVITEIGDCPVAPVVEVMEVGVIPTPPVGMIHAIPRSDITPPPCEVRTVGHDGWGWTIEEDLGQDKPGG